MIKEHIFRSSENNLIQLLQHNPENIKNSLLDIMPPLPQLEHGSIFSVDIYKVLQKYTVVEYSEEISEKLGRPELKAKLHYFLFNEIPDEYSSLLDKKPKLNEEQIKYFDNDKSITPLKHIHNALVAAGFSEKFANLHSKAMLDYYIYKTSETIDMGMLFVLGKLQEQGFLVGVITDRLRLPWEIIENIYLNELKSEKVSSHETNHLKTDGSFNFDIFVERLEKSLGGKINRSKIIHVDDSLKILEIAKKTGFNTIWRDMTKHTLYDFLNILRKDYGITIKLNN